MRRRISLKNSSTAQAHDNWITDESESEINVFEIGTTLIKRRKLIVYPVFAIVTVAAIILLMTPNKYTSTVSILPSGQTDKPSGLRSLAGMGYLITVDENSSELFPEILKSKLIKDTVLSKTYSFDSDGEQTTLTLQDYFGESDRDKLHIALDEISSFRTDKKTGVIRLAVETEYPALSQAMLSTYVAELESFNLHKRRSQAKESEKYLTKQLEIKKQELTKAENELEQFQLENRNWAASSHAEIIKALTSLQREVEILSQAYLLLTQEYELAKFEAQKDVPIVRLLGQPSLPTQKSGPPRTMILALIGILTLLMTAFAVIAAESLRRLSQRPNDDAYHIFRKNMTTAFPKATQAANRLRRTERELV